jgi:hypothetical protein
MKYSPIIEKQIAANHDKKGYWKQSIVMSAAHRLSISLREAWHLFNFYYADFYSCKAIKMTPSFSAKMQVESHNSMMSCIASR